jgi:hypothetical protein
MPDLDAGTGMQDQSDSDSLVVIAAVATMAEAIVVRATLESAGIETVLDNENTNATLGWIGVINPNGFQVRVRARDLEAGLDAIDQGHQASVDLEPISDPFPEDEDIREAARRNSPANFNAQSAYYMAIATLIVGAFLPLTLWLYFQAKQSMNEAPPVDPALYRTHMSRAATLMWATLMLFVLLVLWIVLR